jgi:beta-lactamase superfamily II metal-dependent hydrolase
MVDELFVRIYKIGCGDCIFVRIPDKRRPYHLLIDCGNYCGESAEDLKPALEDVVSLLNENIVPVDHRGHLDLLVATHQHWDHIKGFESSLETFKTIKVDRLWLSVGMKPDHPEAHQFRAFQAQVEKIVNRFVSDRGLSLNPGLLSVLEMISFKEEATKALTTDIPTYHGIQPSYVYREFEKDLPKKDAEKVALDFKDPKTKLFVLAPEKEIDKSYLSHGFGLLQDLDEGEKGAYALIPKDQQIDLPANISLREFRQLKTELQYTSLLAAAQSGHVVNNTSVVLLLEWKGTRLIFPGDAEHESWKLMWKNAQLKLAKPVDFLKVSHHGSCTGTPYDLKDSKCTMNSILESILPVKNASIAQAVVSTEAGVIKADNNPVPHLGLMNEIARRVKNVKEYPPESGKQPQRTDKEKENWITVKIKPRTS